MVFLAIDYRHVNKISASDCFPTPDIPNVLQKVGRSKVVLMLKVAIDSSR